MTEQAKQQNADAQRIARAESPSAWTPRAGGATARPAAAHEMPGARSSGEPHGARTLPMPRPLPECPWRCPDAPPPSTPTRTPAALRLLDPAMPLANGKRRRIPAKGILYRERARPDRVYLIRGGLIKLVSHLPNGRARIVRLHTSSHWIGLEGLLDRAYEHTAIAVDEVEVEHFSVHALQRLLEEHPAALGHLLCQWHGHLTQADRWIADFSTGGIKPRVARLLEYLAELENGVLSDRVELLTVHDLAEILGVTPESVSRIIAGFKRSGILQRQADPVRDVYRLDTVKLRQEARR